MSRSALIKLSSMSSLALATLTVAFTFSPRQAAACGTEAYTGEVCIMAGSYCPANTVELMGQLLAINEFQALYSLMGTTYGGDGRVSFGVPDMRGRAPTGYGTGPGLTSRPWSTKYGQEGVVQTVAQMPQHNHQAVFTPTGGGTGGTSTATGTVTLDVTGSVKIGTSTNTLTTRSNTPVNNAVLGPAQLTTANVYAPAGTSADLVIGPDNAVTGKATGNVSLEVTGGGSSGGGVVTVGNTGGGQAIPTVSPSIAMRYCMVTDGIYPPRP
ncbi:phage tail protein [Pokkaliibacter plantistimulans]|uniref:Phage tail protein n=1 Tax=Proteobacteria bacterium 228 TaxID=2083153 RepID=A0A2S5KLM2_9PROT|nr:tail fiber protein [Pokkaliibacter plantistimulans]PPC75545.1 phage tail protein [Pokkaliibacter plantistimulans]